MTPDELVSRRLASRLRQVRNRIAELSAEAEMLELTLANAAKSTAKPTLKLRKNSRDKWSVRGQVRRYIDEHIGPVRAQAIYDHLRQFDPSLKSSTFRSHIKRMVDDNIIQQEGTRGHYRLVEKHDDMPIVRDAYGVRRTRRSSWSRP